MLANSELTVKNDASNVPQNRLITVFLYKEAMFQNEHICENFNVLARLSHDKAET